MFFFFYEIKFCDFNSLTILPASSFKTLGTSVDNIIPEDVLPCCFGKSKTTLVSSSTFLRITNLFICLALLPLAAVVKSSHALAGISLSNSMVILLVFVTSSLNILFTLFTCLSNSLGNIPLPVPAEPAFLSTNLKISPSSIKNYSSTTPNESD